MTATSTPGAGRILALDLARTTALVGMVIYHFTYDLSAFGWLPPGYATHGGWAIFARIVAGSFLFLAGVSLYLAHGAGIRWRPFLIRAAQIAAGAAIITVTTYFWIAPTAYVFYGILHAILVSSFIGLAFLRLPWIVTLAAAALVVLARIYLTHPAFDAPLLAWVGLYTGPTPRSIDFVPVFPWLAPFLAGLALSKWAVVSGVAERLRSAVPPGPMARAVAWPGRHTLIIYLVHQPVLNGILWLVAMSLR